MSKIDVSHLTVWVFIEFNSSLFSLLTWRAASRCSFLKMNMISHRLWSVVPDCASSLCWLWARKRKFPLHFSRVQFRISVDCVLRSLGVRKWNVKLCKRRRKWSKLAVDINKIYVHSREVRKYKWKLQSEETGQAIARRAQKQNCLCELPATVQTGSAQIEELHREAHA